LEETKKGQDEEEGTSREEKHSTFANKRKASLM
jgi:hypothetical protein